MKNWFRISQGLLLLLAIGVLTSGCARNLKKDGSDSGAFGSGDGSDLFVTELPDNRGDFPPDQANWDELDRFTIYFGYDSFNIDTAERPKLDGAADWLLKNPGARLLIAGHTDERGTVEYNRALGERRALAVRSYLIGLGVDTGMLGTISYGEEMPAASGADENAWRQNRRAQLGVIR